jgi:hypothetical protein
MRHFIMLVDDATVAQQNAVTESFRGKPQGFWHIFSDAWLLVDPTNSLSVEQLRDHLNVVVPGATTLVLPIDRPKTWAGFGQSDDFKWVHEVWPRQS